MKSYHSISLYILLCASTQAQSENPTCTEDSLCNHNHGGAALVIEPFLHIQAAAGYTDLEHSGLQQGAHDPRHTGFNLTGISLGTDILYSEHLAGYAEGIMTWNNHDQWDAEFEEGYAKLMNLPGDIDIKMGRMLASVGTHNNLHNHAWDFVDAHLANIRFLGEDGLITDGVEVQWVLPTSWNNRILVSYGTPVTHEHGEHGDDHDDEHEDHHEDAEMALWEKEVLTARYEASFWPADTCHFLYGASYAQGKNMYDRMSRIYGADLIYTWLEDDFHGKSFVWRNELMWRDVETDDSTFNELGFNSTAIFKPNTNWDIALRYDYLEGVVEPELNERHRISPSLTRHFTTGPVEVHSRLQYNYDHSEERQDDHSIWLQFSFEWGAGDNHVH